MKQNPVFCCILFCISLLSSSGQEHQVEPGTNSRDVYSHLLSSSSDIQQMHAVKKLINRIVANRSSDFIVSVVSTKSIRLSFKLESVEGKLIIVGNSGVAAAWGFHYFITQHCGAYVSWAGRQVALPKRLPVLEREVHVKANDIFTFYQNVCTYSYSYVWWDWDRWEAELDWMALHGINIALAFTAQEAIWSRVYMQLGLSDSEMQAHFGGPAFLAWSRMGNLRGWGGPLTENWMQSQLKLQHQILKRMQELNIVAALPAFAGHIPDALVAHFPKLNVTKLRDWGHFPKQFCCTYLLNVHDAMFSKISSMFFNQYEAEFGLSHIYSADSFNEMDPPSSDPAYLSSFAKKMHEILQQNDPQAIWLLQGWMFRSSSFWGKTQARAFLTGVPKGKLLVLDLASDQSPQFERLDSYFGQPFVWCMLHNYGGNLDLNGRLSVVNERPADVRSRRNVTMVGVGVTPEGIDQNEAVYSFMLENSWRTVPRDIGSWMENFAARRYAAKLQSNASRAWVLLSRKVLDNPNSNFHHIHGENIVTRRPAIGLSSLLWYDSTDVVQAWRYLLLDAHLLHSSQLYRYDLVDIGRQALTNHAFSIYLDAVTHYSRQNVTSLVKSASDFLDLLLELDGLLASDLHFLLGRRLPLLAATSLRDEGNEGDKGDLANRVFNAKNQITLWGPAGGILDYGNKQWSGLVAQYQYRRWKLFFRQLVDAALIRQPFCHKKFEEDVFHLVELPFNYDFSMNFSTHTRGDQIEVSLRLFNKYFSTKRL